MDYTRNNNYLANTKEVCLSSLRTAVIQSNNTLNSIPHNPKKHHKRSQEATLQ